LSANEALFQYLDILRVGIKLDIKGRALRTWAHIGFPRLRHAFPLDISEYKDYALWV